MKAVSLLQKFSVVVEVRHIIINTCKL